MGSAQRTGARNGAGPGRGRGHGPLRARRLPEVVRREVRDPLTSLRGRRAGLGLRGGRNRPGTSRAGAAGRRAAACRAARSRQPSWSGGRHRGDVTAEPVVDRDDRGADRHRLALGHEQRGDRAGIRHGSSTRDFAVSISTKMSLTLTASPTLTFQVTISASTRPSPGSGRLKCFTAMGCGPLPYQ